MKKSSEYTGKLRKLQLPSTQDPLLLLISSFTGGGGLMLLYILHVLDHIFLKYIWKNSHENDHESKDLVLG